MGLLVDVSQSKLAATSVGQVWNLRTWQLEMIDWPASNSQRADIRFDPFTDRSGDVHEDSVGVLPENERAQVAARRRGVAQCWCPRPRARPPAHTGSLEWEPARAERRERDVGGRPVRLAPALLARTILWAHCICVGWLGSAVCHEMDTRRKSLQAHCFSCTLLTLGPHSKTPRTRYGPPFRTDSHLFPSSAQTRPRREHVTPRGPLSSDIRCALSSV
jgi:hypothetical protein